MDQLVDLHAFGCKILSTAMSEAKRRDDHPATPFCSAEDARQAWTSSLPEKVQRVKSFKLQLLINMIIHFLFLGLFGFRCSA